MKVFKIIGGHAVPRLDAVSAGWPVLLFGIASAILAAVLAGLLPAFRASRLDPIHVIKAAGPKTSTGAGERRLLRTVTIAQTALTLALLVGAGLLIRTMVNLANVQSGYETQHILTMSVTAVGGEWTDFHRRALERVSAIPGVERAAFAWGVPLTGNNWPGAIEIEGQPAPARESDRIAIPLRSVTQGYFELLHLPILDGRDIRSSDDRKAPPVAVVNQAFADRYFPEQHRHRQEILDRRPRATRNRDRRRGRQWPHGQSDASRRARNLFVALAGFGLFERSGGTHGCGSEDGDGWHPARNSRRTPHRRH